MQVTVRDNELNVRVGAPSLNAPTNKFLAPGTAIDVEDQLYSGDMYQGVATWLKDDADNYYWSGGLNYNLQYTPTSSNIAKYPWNINLLGINQIWEYSKGENVNVAIIDSGIDLNNNDLNSSILAKYNILDNSQNVQDNYFHGTYCATILHSKGNFGVFGIAPNCNLIIIKIANTSSDYTGTNELNGIKKAIELGADIISMSFGSTAANNDINALLQTYMSDGKICIAAAGDNKNDVVNYPANLKGMVSVGNIGCNNPNSPYTNNSFFLSDSSPGVIDTTTGEGITILAPGDGVGAYDLNSNVTTPYPGTSLSAPFVAGVAAIWLSVLKKKNVQIANNHLEFRNFIITNAIKDQLAYDPQTWGNGIINPLKICSL